jgi:hypothetical protein
MQSVEPVLENAIKTLQKVVDVRGMGKKWDTWALCSCFKIEKLFVNSILKKWSMKRNEVLDSNEFLQYI